MMGRSCALQLTSREKKGHFLCCLSYLDVPEQGHGLCIGIEMVRISLCETAYPFTYSHADQMSVVYTIV